MSANFNRLQVLKNFCLHFLSTISILLTLGGCDSSNTFIAHVSPAAEYNSRVEIAVKQISSDELAIRDTLISKLSRTNTYKKLVVEKEVNAKYLPLLTSIGIEASTFDKLTKTSLISEKYYSILHSGLLNEDEAKFESIVFGINAKGGLTPAIVEIYYRYKSKFGYFGDSTMNYLNNSGTNTSFNVPYNLSIALAIFEPNNQEVLEAFYEHMGNDYFQWQDSKNSLPENSDFPYVAFEKSFREHLNEVAPESKYNIYKYKRLGQSVLAGYFEITADDWNFSKVINTGNQFMNIKASNGNTFLIIQATYKNLDQEGRTIFGAGSVFVEYHGKEYKFDKTEAVLADGFGVTFEALNPLSKKTTLLIFPMSTEFKGMAFWQPAGCDERIYLGTITKKK